MPAGALRERVTFQRRAPAGDGMGNTLGAWADIPDCIGVAAELTPLRHGEVVLSEGVQGRILYRVTVRFTDALAALQVGDRMKDTRSARTFNVSAPPINPDQKRHYLQIQAQLGGADG
jgi:head-tail adaptor